jgi:hypothetical protein
MTSLPLAFPALLLNFALQQSIAKSFVSSIGRAQFNPVTGISRGPIHSVQAALPLASPAHLIRTYFSSTGPRDMHELHACVTVSPYLTFRPDKTSALPSSTFRTLILDAAPGRARRFQFVDRQWGNPTLRRRERSMQVRSPIFVYIDLLTRLSLRQALRSAAG